MKKIEAVIRHFKLDAVKEALVDSGFSGITVSEVRGYGRQLGQREWYRGAEYDIDFVPKLMIELVVPDDELEKAIDVVSGAAHTGEVGDGKITVSDVVEVIRIRTSERGAIAL